MDVGKCKKCKGAFFQKIFSASPINKKHSLLYARRVKNSNLLICVVNLFIFLAGKFVEQHQMKKFWYVLIVIVCVD